MTDANSAPKMAVMKTRPEFLRTASARRQTAPAFLLQARDRKDGDPKIQVGFTASKKTGNSVVRSRAKRRLREAARAVLLPKGQPGWDYVLVARPGATVTRLFTDLLADLETALAKVHEARK
ncbi:ribonuclease P protein component [Xinfangfangia sp. CPCC 101601]|uniref:Ribonuclease P protein component n=2 Tax=Pseudogemmobacter lacusdianii TaxID=3069608 RepID=A0ABU0W0D3_9RHOB|nr:ribonuclease P protein component [Xinfangfangia sp. CPCC 101601]MDQ2067474.1 ribonuclease P protein component [Xinfangfangia sp. CPCC 101601]